jgi:ketosteroid isomerase-like protein
LVRRAVLQGQEAFNRRDLEAVAAKYHPDIELHPPKELVGLGAMQPVYRGHAGLIEYLRDWSDAWDEAEARPLELLDLGDRLLVLGEMEQRGSASGVRTVNEYAQLWQLHDGLAVSERTFTRWSEARAAAGLPDL